MSDDRPKFKQLIITVPAGNIPYAEIVFVRPDGERDEYLVTILHESKRDTTFDDHPLET